MILPHPKKAELQQESVLIPFETTLFVNGFRKKAARLTELFFPGMKAVAINSDAFIHSVVENTGSDDAYRLEITPHRITITHSSYLGLRNGLATLSVLASAEEGGYRIPCGTVEDKPDANWRGIMLDLARGVRPFDQLQEDLILIAKSKMNVLHLHLDDSKGICYQSEALPECCWLPNAYTKAQMKEIVELADVLGLMIVPEHDVPAHAKKVVGMMPHLGCDIGEGDRTPWTVCAGTEEVYELIEGVIDEMCEMFPSPYFHIGSDELTFEKNPELRQLCHWNECKKCRKKMEEENLSDRQDLYYYFILRVYEMVKKHRRTMMMWSDQIDCNRPCPLPRDILMHFWRVAGPGRGPTENCSMNNQLKMGFCAVNSLSKDTYIDIERFLQPEKIKDWLWYTSPETDPEYKNQILGGECCAWEYGNALRYLHYNRTFAPSVFIMADRLWNEGEMNFDEEYSVLLTRAVLGATTPKGLDFFRCIGAFIPPRNDELAHYDRITCPPEIINEVLETLKGLAPADFGSRYRIEEYIKVLEAVLEKLAEGTIEAKEEEVVEDMEA